VMKVVTLAAIAALIAGCASAPAPKSGQQVASSGGGMVCASEARTGSHLAKSSCVTAEQAKARHEASLQTMRNATAAQTTGSATSAQH
jgi:hypothetical protein